MSKLLRTAEGEFVTLNSAAVKVLKELRKRHKKLGLPPNSTLFHSKRDGLIKNPRRWFATALNQARIRGVTWHTLRHTFASRLVMAGVDLKTVQERMGHKTIAMTARYAHLAPTHKLRGAGDPSAFEFGFGTGWPQNGYWSQKSPDSQRTEEHSTY